MRCWPPPRVTSVTSNSPRRWLRARRWCWRCPGQALIVCPRSQANTKSTGVRVPSPLAQEPTTTLVSPSTHLRAQAQLAARSPDVIRRGSPLKWATRRFGGEQRWASAAQEGPDRVHRRDSNSSPMAVRCCGGENRICRWSRRVRRLYDGIIHAPSSGVTRRASVRRQASRCHGERSQAPGRWF